MIEHLGKDFVFRGDVLPIADYYDGMDDDVQFADIEANAPDEAALIDDVISGYEHKPVATDKDMSALAQGALFLLDQDVQTKVVRSRIRQHPSAQNTLKDDLDNIAGQIIRAYHEEMNSHSRPKEILDHDVSIAVIRNINHLDNGDLERIAEMLGCHKDYFKPKSRPAVEEDDREPDFRERQFKD